MTGAADGTELPVRPAATVWFRGCAARGRLHITLYCCRFKPACSERGYAEAVLGTQAQLLLLVVHSGHFPCINKIISEAVLPQNCTVVFAAAGP